MTHQPLSPAAWAVMSAASVAKDHAGCPIAVILRAVADQVVPDAPDEAMYFTNEAIRLNRMSIRHKLLAIATELEAANA